MKVDIRYRPAYALAMVTLDPQETVQVEGGAMVGMSANMKMETGATGGFLKSLSRKMFGGESFFLNTFTGVHEGDSVAIAPPLPGDIEVIEMHGETLMVQSGAYLASSAGINVETKWSGAKTFFGSEGLIMLRISGTGLLIVSSYGAIHTVELAQDQKYVVDTGHLVTFEEHLKFDL